MFHGLISRLDIVKERMFELEDMTRDSSQTEKRKKTKKKKKKYPKLRENYKRRNTYDRNMRRKKGAIVISSNNI